MANIITTSVFSSDFFPYHPDLNEFITEISNIPGKPNLFSQIYDDACDAGFGIKSERSGKVAYFYYEKADEGKERGEVYGWWFKPIPETKKNFPQLKNTKVLVIND